MEVVGSILLPVRPLVRTVRLPDLRQANRVVDMSHRTRHPQVHLLGMIAALLPSTSTFCLRSRDSGYGGGVRL